MKQKLQKKLFTDFPKILFYVKKNENKDPRLPMAWGIETGDGWSDLICNLCKKIQEYCDKTGIQVIALNLNKNLEC